MGQRFTLPATVAMVPVARHGVTVLLADFERLADARLVATELFVCAVRATDADVTMTVTCDAKVRMEVHDRRGQHPRPCSFPPDPDVPDGLAIVSAVATEFGSRRHLSGDRTTWVVLAP